MYIDESLPMVGDSMRLSDWLWSMKRAVGGHLDQVFIGISAVR